MPTIDLQTNACSSTDRRHRASHCRDGDRRGSLYLSVLGVGMIVSAIGMSALVVARVNLRSTTWRQDRREARVLADSAVELGAGVVVQDTAWRASFLNSQEYPSTPLSMGNGTIAWKLVDSDGNLADDLADTVRLYGIGRVGQAVYTKSVLLEPTDAGVTCLEVALHADRDIHIYNDINCNQTISANDDVDAWQANTNTDIEVVDQFDGTLNGTLTQGITPRQLPGGSVFDYYLNNGTWIDHSDVPGGTIERVVLSPGNNPFGDGRTNPQGIYVIDCKNQWIRIKLVRLVGTLVLLNPGSGSDVDNDQHWEPAVRNFPVLMVDGSIDFNWHGENMLRESVAGVNYNPGHTPYLDQSDTDQTDEYPGVIKGLIYISSNLNIYHECVLVGTTVVGQDTSISAATTLTYDDLYVVNPPPGFRSGSAMTISAGSWRREVSQ